jgi:hypothetical protein
MQLGSASRHTIFDSFLRVTTRAHSTRAHYLLTNRACVPLLEKGPAFNFMMRAAYDDGAQYLYRINDDTEFVDPWAWDAVQALMAFKPPNLGVVGELSPNTNGFRSIPTRLLSRRFLHLDPNRHGHISVGS